MHNIKTNFLINCAETATSSLSKKWNKLRQRCLSFQETNGLDCSSGETQSTSSNEFHKRLSNITQTQHIYDNHPQFQNNYYTSVDNRNENTTIFYPEHHGFQHEEGQRAKTCKCKSSHSASVISLDRYNEIDSHLHYITNQQSRLQYFDDDKKVKSRRLSLFGSERKLKKERETSKEFDLRQFKSVSMRCPHHHQHHSNTFQPSVTPVIYPNQDMQQLAKGTLSHIKDKFNTCGRKKRSIYDVFFNHNSNNKTKSESGIRQPKFYVPLSSAELNVSQSYQQHEQQLPVLHQHRVKRGGNIDSRSVRSRSVCGAAHTPTNTLNFYTNNFNQNSSIKKSNTFDPYESLEITSFLLSKLKLNQHEKCRPSSTFLTTTTNDNKVQQVSFM